ncbi:hypothetical protein [Micromonospora ureilytica]|uniref:hypothetical protein n=1 Tax=Micromonospora ureilytica TaxID=709868 RepID=UPI000F5ED47F|nr:hypothetical protein [Micromonospora ureilytica]
MSRPSTNLEPRGHEIRERDANPEVASLRWCTLGGTSMPAVLGGARVLRLPTPRRRGGAVIGPVFDDEEATRSLGGAELEAWFSGQGAENVKVVG